MCYIGFKLFKSLKYLQGNLLNVQISTAYKLHFTLSLIKMAAIGIAEF